ncbi:uncharacterized protein AB675_750 [Cyphellophora attinorum]|uniref:Uncharacterized protein n=1 Tax=Cyphellophora attinorum TaxID=1664694 RepID=A0A0N0NS15_9EURO|nr:uncharacterized protein AB675_750 [Phialophora attinorum]KPI45731.1 hypothetical protein AB675_750 [Phialophora attinorum]
MASATYLSRNDNAVLGALFDPESSLSNSTPVADTLPSNFSSTELQDILETERRALLPLNVERPSEDTIATSISDLDTIIEQWPEYASAWNNRAQTRRMLFEIQTLHQEIEALRLIMGDLSQAIALATPQNPSSPVPAAHAKVLASAHTHRGYLLYAASKSEDLATAMTSSIQSLEGLDSEQLEERASHDFSLGGRYGNDMARQLAVRTNPYAKLCGSIVKEAMQKEVMDYNMQIHGMKPAL